MSFLKNNPELKEKVDALKAKYGDNNVFAYKAKDGKVAFFKRPDRATVDASTSVAKKSAIKSDEVIAKACFIDGDKSIIEDDKYFYGLSKWLGGLIEIIEGELSPL